MNSMRNLVGLLTIQSKVPMKDGRVDIYALVGEIGPENFSIFKSERFGVGPTKEQIEKGDYSEFPYGRFSGKVKKASWSRCSGTRSRTSKVAASWASTAAP